jgi:hypothetical protein
MLSHPGKQDPMFLKDYHSIVLIIQHPTEKMLKGS